MGLLLQSKLDAPSEQVGCSFRALLFPRGSLRTFFSAGPALCFFGVCIKIETRLPAHVLKFVLDPIVCVTQGSSGVIDRFRSLELTVPFPGPPGPPVKRFLANISLPCSRPLVSLLCEIY